MSIEEKHSLLPNFNSTSKSFASNTAENNFSDEDGEDDSVHKSNNVGGSNYLKIPIRKEFHLKMKNRRRNQIHRRTRRLFFWLSIMLMTMTLITLYYPWYTSLQARQVALSDWGRNTSRNIAEYILPDNETSLLEPREICQTRDKFFLLVVVCSSLNNFAVRQTIRETWGNTTEFNYGMFLRMHGNLKNQYLDASENRIRFYSDYLGLQDNHTLNNETIIPVRVVFFVGLNKPKIQNADDDTSESIESINRLNNEFERYQDIIQEDFIDTYNNLTLKSVLMLKWVTHRCIGSCAFVMKCDDDTFVNVPNLLHYLLGGTIPIYNDTLDLYSLRTYKVLNPNNRLTTIHNYLAGYLFCTARPIANRSSKWYMPNYIYPNEKYPKYLSGAGYIMSIDIVPQLFEAALNTTLVHLEDVFITGICAEKLRIPRMHYPLFSYILRKKLCSVRGSITQHELKDNHLSEAYAFVTNLTNRCPSPGTYFKRIPSVRKNSDCG